MKLLFSFLLHRKSWLLVLMVTFILLWSAFIVFQSDDFYKLERNWYLKPAPCRLPDEKLRDMAELTLLMSSVLDKLQIPHVLCFGTLWGALRNGAILPWDNNVDICIMYKDMMGTSTEELVNSFNYNGAQAAYISKHGLFEIHYKNAVGYINVFANSYGENMYQIGWGRWSFYSKVQRLVLPSRFMEAPFPKAKFYNKMLPVPHEDIEMLKYLYPNDWWLVSKPPGC